MKIVIADAGALISLGHIGQISLITDVFGDFYLVRAVWNELQNYTHPGFDYNILKDLEQKVLDINKTNFLANIMDYGESESLLLYLEIKADYLLIDDRKAREIAEDLGINCIGTLGLLIKGKQKGLIKELRPFFEQFLKAGRFFSINLLNQVLYELGEETL